MVPESERPCIVRMSRRNLTERLHAVEEFLIFVPITRELVLSDVHWRWILDEVNWIAKQDQIQVAFVRVIESGFCDPNDLLETVPVTDEVVHMLERVFATSAPLFKSPQGACFCFGEAQPPRSTQLPGA